MHRRPAHRACVAALLLCLVAAGTAFAKDRGAAAEWTLPTTLDRLPRSVCCGLPAAATFARPDALAGGSLAGPLAGLRLGASTALRGPEFPLQTKDAEGLRRDTYYFMGYQFAAVAILYAMPESVTSWSDEDKSDYSMSKWWNNVQDPGLDSDDFYLNWVVHPYWGASYFVRARERGYSNTASFWYSVLLSTIFEFGAEALAEEPSYQDLVVTPVLGSLVGIWFMDVREGVRERTDSRGYRSTGDQWVWVLTDPLGAINRQVDRVFGREADVTFQPFVANMSLADEDSARPRADTDTVVGVRLTLNW